MRALNRLLQRLVIARADLKRRERGLSGAWTVLRPNPDQPTQRHAAWVAPQRRYEGQAARKTKLIKGDRRHRVVPAGGGQPMRCSSAFVAVTFIGSMILPGHADAQTRDQQVRQGGPLVLRVRPSGFDGRIPAYLGGTTYEPRNAFDPIELAPPLGPSANNITITLPVSSAGCRFTRVDTTLFASPGCLGR
jgi:hypothetical protein